MGASLKPIVKWAGGKSRLLGELLQRVPAEVRTYAEPFAGGAALFFALADDARHRRRAIGKFVLCDENAELVACYRAVKRDVDGVIAALSHYRYDRELYYSTREQSTESMSDVERAARLLFLNRTCFNGLWRVNSSGRFNVPFGRYKNPRIVDEDGLRAASAALAKTEIHHGDFRKATKKLGAGDFVYFDPPYAPVSKTASFTTYAAGGFGPDDQARLVGEMRRLRGAGALVMLSNADTPETRALYAEFPMYVVYAARSINSDISKRGHTRELVVTSWGMKGIYELDQSSPPERAAAGVKSR